MFSNCDHDRSTQVETKSNSNQDFDRGQEMCGKKPLLQELEELAVKKNVVEEIKQNYVRTH